MGLPTHCRASHLKIDYFLTLFGEETKTPMGYLCNLLLLNRKARRKWKITIVKTQHCNLRTPDCKTRWHSSTQHPLGEILSVAVLPPRLTPEQSSCAQMPTRTKPGAAAVAGGEQSDRDHCCASSPTAQGMMPLPQPAPDPGLSIARNGLKACRTDWFRK